jgi:hypothetical protein
MAECLYHTFITALFNFGAGRGRSGPVGVGADRAGAVERPQETLYAQ